MSDPIISVYSDARTEYTKQLCVFLVPSYFQFFLALLEKAKGLALNEPKRLLWHFQNLLNDIPEWNMEKVNTEIQNIQNSCGCDYLEDLLTAVFIAYTKVLTAIRISSSKHNKVQITVPKVEQFLFRVLCETSKLLWGSTYLFREDVNSIEKQQNYRSIEGLLQEGIAQSVRGLVPVKSILKDFVSNEESDDEEKVTPLPITLIEEKPTTAEVIQPLIEEPAVTEEPVQQEQPEEPIKNEIIEPPVSQPPVIRIDDKPEVAFAKFDAVFDSENPEGSDMIHGGFDSSGLEVVDDDSIPMATDSDSQFMDILDNNEADESPLDDFEVLV